MHNVSTWAKDMAANLLESTQLIGKQFYDHTSSSVALEKVNCQKVAVTLGAAL